MPSLPNRGRARRPGRGRKSWQPWGAFRSHLTTKLTQTKTLEEVWPRPQTGPRAHSGCRGRVRRVGHRAVRRLSLLVLKDHLAHTQLFPRGRGPEAHNHQRFAAKYTFNTRPDPLVLADLLLQVRRHLAKVAQVELCEEGPLAEADRLKPPRPRRAARTDARSNAP